MDRIGGWVLSILSILESCQKRAGVGGRPRPPRAVCALVGRVPDGTDGNHFVAVLVHMGPTAAIELKNPCTV